MTNLALNLTRTASLYPDAVALRCDDHTLTFREFDDMATQFAGFLAHKGLRPGDRVGLMLPNVPAFAAAYYGILRAGATVVPMNPLQSAREVQFYLANTDARLLFADPNVAAAAEQGASAADARCWLVDDDGLNSMVADAPRLDSISRSDEDTAVILHTSGTTGVPKGAELTHANLSRNQEVTARTLLHLGPGDVVIGCLPLFHAFGMTCALNASVATGAALTLLPRFNPVKALEIIARDRVTIFEGVPTMYAAMLHAHTDRPFNTGSLRICISGGAAMPTQILRGFEVKFDCTILEGYGLSETSPVACFNQTGHLRKVGSIGTPVEGVQMQVVDEARNPIGPDKPGEIEIKGHCVMKGYWRWPEATAAAIHDGWLATGDIGQIDEDGYYFIVDRKKELIIRGGYNVYPREIEDVLYEHAAVAEAAVIGLPHPTLGEEVAAAVALKPGTTATPDELQAFVKQRVADYKYPRQVWLVDDLPKSATGKILRREVRALRERSTP